MQLQQLFSETAEELRRVMEAAAIEGSDVALVSQPWGGRDELLQHALEAVDGFEEIQLSPDSTAPELGGSPAVVYDCHHLYRRSIGGFDGIEHLSSAAVSGEASVVASWNSHSWSYLRQATEVERVFDHIVEVPAVDADQALTLLESEYGVEDPEYLYGDEAADEEHGGDAEADVRSRLKRLYHRSPTTTPAEVLVEDSAGNPESLRRIYEARAEGGGVDAELPELRHGESYLLWLVTAHEAVEFSYLDDAVEHDVDSTVDLLAQRDVVEVEDELVRPTPEAYPEVVSHLSSRRMVW